jgi:hypothetical protein
MVAVADPLEPGRVLVIVPTFTHHSTIDLAVHSILSQSYSDLEVVIIGDGATAEVAAAVQPLLTDLRVRFIQAPKSPSRAELIRHKILSETTATVVCYLGDDDLMLPSHVQTMVDLLDSVDFAQALPMVIELDGSLLVYPTDLADESSRLWHLHPERNGTPLSGAAHRVASYRRLPFGWREPPAGRWSDHYMWEQWFTTDGMTYRTSDEPTVIKLEGALRKEMTPDERRAEILAWSLRMTEPGFAPQLREQSILAYRSLAVHLRIAHDRLYDGYRDALSQLDDLSALHESSEQAHLAYEGDLVAQVHDLHRTLSTLNSKLLELIDTSTAAAAGHEATHALQDKALAESTAALATVRATRTWRLHDRLTRNRILRKLMNRPH